MRLLTRLGTRRRVRRIRTLSAKRDRRLAQAVENVRVRYGLSQSEAERWVETRFEMECDRHYRARAVNGPDDDESGA